MHTIKNITWAMEVLFSTRLRKILIFYEQKNKTVKQLWQKTYHASWALGKFE